MSFALKIKKELKKYIKEPLKNIYWRASCAGIANPPLTRPISGMVFVCKGNICRSPFAEYYAKKMMNNKGDCSIASAGLEVDKSLPPPAEAVKAAESFKLDISNHQSRRIERWMLDESDMVIAMETEQFRELRRRYPENTGKIYLLPLFDPLEETSYYLRYNIVDPYGRSEEDFNACYTRIGRCLEPLFDYVISG